MCGDAVGEDIRGGGGGHTWVGTQWGRGERPI